MRYVPVNCLRPGMVCGKKILGYNGQLLLNKGAVLQTGYIDRIIELGLAGVYIEDEISKDINVQDIIPVELRTRSVYLIKNIFTGIASHKPENAENIKLISKVVDEMLDSILSHQDMQLNMMNLKIFDDYTYFHSVNVGVLSVLLGVSLGFDREDLKNLGVSAMLHDIGKVFIPKEILNKPGKLNEDEYNTIKYHSEKGYRYLNKHYFIQPVILTGVIDHHEKINGKGYPAGKTNRNISRFGKILSVADVFDALTSDRPYRKAMPLAEAIEFMIGGSSSDFDPDIIKAFLRCVVPYPTGITVQLSNGYIGIIEKNYSQACLRPVVRVLWESGKAVEPYSIDLFLDSSKYGLTVIGMVDPIDGYGRS